ncbi:hypothetical protein F5544_19655 [Nocardia arthritidis]|uniref:Molybdenum cofactor sulfurase middle domain-containing protein n=1 Tax=Nocardia arthritidis TaxID=228602 RepID=A0A6G9YEZ8_9NOCA|nr:hypothetical protein F5544_19655 [Nocardia arthritidis]
MIGSVARLTRFPVKSTAGEHITATLVDARGLVHDRGGPHTPRTAGSRAARPPDGSARSMG